MAQEPQMTQCPTCGKSFPTTVKLCPDDGAVLEHQPPTATQIGKVLDGKYRLDAFLSQGGMGGVYRATHVMLNKNVAVKLINPELVTSPEIVRRFQREARAATTLSHPNIVSVYDLGQTADGTLYIAMEFVDGQSLRSLIEKGGPLPLVRTLTIARQLTSALSLAHRHGIIHRDLKPHNVMLARTEDGHQVAKLVDFGIAKTFEEGTQLTVAGFMPGTPQYMSPEQAEGIAVDARSDLYSLGIVIYEMLTGQVPFNAPSLPSLLIKHIKEAPQPPSLKNPNVSIPPEVEAITMRCLAKSPNDRFQTADELGAALDRVASTLPTAAASMQATVLAVDQPSSAAAWNAATIPASANAATVPAANAANAVTVPAPANPAPTVKVQPPVEPRPSGDTRPTAVPAAGSVSPSTPAPSKATGPVVVALLIAAALAIVVYTKYFSGPTAPPAAATSSAENRPASDAPAASPAMATPREPTPTPAPPTAAPAPGGESQPSPASAAPERPSEPSPSVSAPSGASTASKSAAAGAPSREPAPATRASAPTGKAGAGSSPSAAVAAPVAAPAAAPAVTPGRPAAAGQSPAPAPPAAAPSAQAAPAAFPESPTVFFQCAGAPALCGQLRPAVADALEKAGLTSVRNAARADINVLAMVEIVDERVDRQFGNTFAVRNYTIEITGEAPRTNEDVPMPPPTSVSFDAKLGAERAVEKSRVVASDIVDRVKAFAKKKHGG